MDNLRGHLRRKEQRVRIAFVGHLGLRAKDCMSYSQRNEEQYILEACKDSAVRRVLDIGAWHPTQFSNSRALIEAGWDAVLVEPSPGPVRNLVQEYGFDPQFNNRHLDQNLQRITVLCAAVGLEPGLATLQITDDAVSASEVKPEWRERGGYLGAMTIPQVTFEQICDWYGNFGFVSIDTEGGSTDIFKVILEGEMFPKCICVEHDGRIVEITKAAQERGYKIAYVSEENVIVCLP